MRAPWHNATIHIVRAATYEEYVAYSAAHGYHVKPHVPGDVYAAFYMD